MADGRRLPRGRHDLSRDEVEADQRRRILRGVAQTMAADGYARTPVAAVIAAAGVSRETYYRFFDNKLDGFLAAFDAVAEALLASLADAVAVDAPGAPIDRACTGLDRYFEQIAEHRAEARLFLIEAFAAGPAAIERRLVVQQRIADRLAAVLGATSDEAQATCRTFVAAVSAVLVGPLVADDPDAIRALAGTMSAELRRFHAAGLVTT